MLVAGRGTRLESLTNDRPKCMVPVAGRPIVERAFASILSSGLVANATVVAGYRGQLIERLVPQITPPGWARVIHNHHYAVSGTALSTLLGVQASPPGDLLIVEGDVVFAGEAVEALSAASRPNMSATLVSHFVDGVSGSAVRLGRGQIVTAWLRNIHDEIWRRDRTLRKTVNLHWIADAHRITLLQTLHAAAAADLQTSLEAVMNTLVTERLFPIRAVDVGDIPWWEVDDQSDLARANELFG